jgi:arylsulfatase A-like enzyme/Flp pilus assembly protein TadD
MPGRARPRAAIGCGLAIALSLACNRVTIGPVPAADAPSVLLVTIDTLRWDHVGAYGGDPQATPTLDALAREGARFETAIAAAPLTLPSHASILTGLLPPRHGARHNGVYRVPAAVETLAERFARAGYATGAVVGAAVLERRYGLAQGFASYDDVFATAGRAGEAERPAAEVTARARAWLAQHEGPFFLWLHYFDPHADYQPPPPFAERFAGRPYDGEIAAVDAALSEVLGDLERSGRLARTCVAVTADHGESLGEHGEATHAYTLYDSTLRVPLILRGARVPAGRVVPGVIRTVDIAPTLLALSGLAPFEDVDGQDLGPLLDGTAGAAVAPRIAYAETLAPRLDHGMAPLHALRSASLHYVRAPRPELYALASDPRQLENLAETQPERAAAELAALAGQLDGVLAAAGPEESIEVDAASRSRLESLGYAVPSAPVPENGMDPKDGLPWIEGFLDALFALQRGDRAAARSFLERMVAALPTSAHAHALLARILLDEGRADAALLHAESAAHLVPQAPDYPLLVGDAQAALGRADAARRAYERAGELDPAAPLPHVGLAWLALRAGALDEALREAERAAELAPVDASVREAAGEVLERAGAYERALAHYEEALRLAPEALRLHAILAIQLARLGREQESREARARAGPAASDPLLSTRLAIVYAARGEGARAEAILREVLGGRADYEPARRALERLQRERGAAMGTAPADSGG